MSLTNAIQPHLSPNAAPAPRVLHLTFNYPDELSPQNTVAVRRLIECTTAITAADCISLHRIAWYRRARVLVRTDHTIVACPGLPLHLGLRRFLDRCIAAIQTAGVRPSEYALAHAHKLSLEGYIAHRLLERNALPYCLTLRASDLLLLRYRRAWRRECLPILADAGRIVVLAPWLSTSLRSLYGRLWRPEFDDKLVPLGNVVDGPMHFSTQTNGRYVTVLKLNRSQLGRKNLSATLRAFARLRAGGRSVTLDIIGAGSGIELVRRSIRQLGLEDHVRLLGHIPHSAIIDTLKDYKALVLCSYPETFGLTYIEALRAGIPAIYARDTGVDGVFPHHEIGIPVSDRTESGITRAIAKMEDHYPDFKASVGRLQDSGELTRFTPTCISERLRNKVYGATTACALASRYHGTPLSILGHL